MLRAGEAGEAGEGRPEIGVAGWGGSKCGGGGTARHSEAAGLGLLPCRALAREDDETRRKRTAPRSKRVDAIRTYLAQSHRKKGESAVSQDRRYAFLSDLRL